MRKRVVRKQFEINKQPHFSLRKLTIGVASVLVGTSIYFMQPDTQIVKADTISDNLIAAKSVKDKPANSDEIPKLNTYKIAKKKAVKATNKTKAATVYDKVETNSANQANNSNNATNNTGQANNNNNVANKTDQASDVNQTVTDIPTNQEPNQVSSTNQNKAQAEPKVTSKSSQTKWNGLDVDYDDTSKTLSIPGGKVSDPKPVAKSVDNADQIEHIKITDKLVLNGDAVGLFGNLPNLMDITGLENLDTKYVTNMDYMFANDPKLTKLDLKPLNTSSALSMNNMFSGSSKLADLDFSNFDTSKTQFMMHMFDGATGLTKLDLSTFDTNNVIDMSYMFHNATNLTDINMSGTNWKAEKLQLAMHMFDGCTNLEALDISTLNTPNIIDLSYMFNNCTNLKTIKTGIVQTPELKYINSMFNGCTSLTGDVEIGFDLQKVDDLSSMFMNCPNIESITFTNLDPKKPIAAQFMNHMFDSCINLKAVNGFENLVTHKLANTSYMFNNCFKLESINLSGLDTSNVKYMNNMFNDASSIKTLDLSNFDVSNVISMSYMFSDMTKLTDINLANWDPANVIYMSHMFDGTSGIEKLDLSSFKADSVTDTSYMFNNCTALKEINLANFSANKVQYFNSMFNNCKGLTSLDLTSFKTDNATDMNNMFNNCSNLVTLKMPNFNTSKVTDMQYMFFYDYLLKELDLSNFDMSNTTGRTGMLSGLANLNVLKLGQKSQLKGTDLDTSKNWVKVGKGTITEPKGNREYTSNELINVFDGAKDADTYVHVDRASYQIIIEYQDLDDNGKVIATDIAKGIPGFVVPYQDTFNNKIADLNKQNYVYSAQDSTLPLTTENDIQIPDSVTGDTKLVIGLRHKKATFKPGENNPFDQQNYDNELIKTVTRTIHYSGSPENIPDSVQSATFKRNGIVDLVNGNLTYSNWDKDSDIFKAVVSPTFPHYQADKLTVSEMKVTPDLKDITENVAYSPIPQIDYTFNFIDQDNANESIAPIIKQSIEQNNNMQVVKTSEIKNVLAALAEKHYKLINDPFGNDDALAVNDKQTNFNFVFAHEKTAKQFAIKQNYQIKYVDQAGQKLKDADILARFADNSFIVTYDYDLVTNKIADKSKIQIKLPDKDQLAQKVPVINGYLASQNTVSEKDIAETDSLTSLKQLITADWLKEHQSGIDSSFTLSDSVITVSYQKVGKLVPVDSEGKTLGDATPYINDPDDPTKILTEQKAPTIAGYTAKTNTITPTDSLKDTKVVYTKNKVTNIVNINFLDQDNDNQAISGVNPIVIKDTEVGQAIAKPAEIADILAKLDKQGYELVKDPFADSLTATEGTQDVNYLFKHKQTKVTDSVTQKSITHFLNINEPDPDGYEGFSDLVPPHVQEVTFTREGLKDEVTGEVNWVSDYPAYIDAKSVIAPVVNGYFAASEMANGSRVYFGKDSENDIRYQRTGRIIPVDETGKEIPNAEQPHYTSGPDKATEVPAIQQVPDIKGYTTKDKTVTIFDPTDPTKDTYVTYVKDSKPVTPVDPDVPVTPPDEPNQPAIDNSASLVIVVHDDTIKQDLPNYQWSSGKVNKGDKVAYDWQKVKQDLINHGYEIVNEPVIPTTCQDSAQIITIHVKHKVVTISKKQPQIAGNKINQGNAVWPSSDLYETVGQYIVYFKDENGKTLRKPVKQTMKFSRELQIDAVTGEILNLNSYWQPEHNNYANVKVPQIAGYKRPKASLNNSSLVDGYLLGPVGTSLDLQDTIIYQAIKSDKIKNDKHNQEQFNNKDNNSALMINHKPVKTNSNNVPKSKPKAQDKTDDTLPKTNNDKLSGLELSLLGLAFVTLGLIIKPKNKQK